MTIVETEMRPAIGLTDVDEVLSFIGAERCRITVRMQKDPDIQREYQWSPLDDQGSLLLIDYEKGNKEPGVTAIKNTKAFAPLFSPYGKMIVYHTTFTATDIFVINLETFERNSVGFGASPSWFKDKESGQLYVYYRTQNDAFFSPTPEGQTFRVAIDDSGKAAGEPEVICEYGYAGSVSDDGRYLVNGFMTAAVYDLVEKKAYSPAGYPYRGVINQACNVTVAPDNAGHVVFLRMPHAIIAHSEKDGSNEQWIVTPPGFREWQTPKYSNDSDYITAGLLNKNELYDMHIIRLSDEKTLQLSEDGGLLHAHLWIDRSTK